MATKIIEPLDARYQFFTDAKPTSLTLVLLFWAAHVPLALLMHRFTPLANAHAVATLLVGIWTAATASRPERVAYVGAYIVGSEVLWRMSEIDLFWETGKYAVVAIFFIGLWRFIRVRPPLLPAFSFLLLLPALWQTVAYMSPSEARNQISFNLSGHLALMISAWFFSQLEMTPVHLKRFSIAFIGPLIGIATITFYGIVSNPFIEFTNSSNSATSGGYGPNQVSAVLGLGALLAFLLLLSDALDFKLRIVILSVLVLLAVQTAMTFSRGGLMMAVGSAIVGLFYVVRSRGAFARIVPLVGLVALIFYFFLIPYLNALTGGALMTRMQDINATHRDELIADDMQAWSDAPVLGVGIGNSKLYHAASQGREVAAHTEFSRILAEHGSLGLLALALLLISGLLTLKHSQSLWATSVKAALLTWSLLFMLINSMRLAAPSVVFGLAFALMLGSETKVLHILLSRESKQELDDCFKQV